MSMKLKLEKRPAKYGAEMGRINVLPSALNADPKLHLEKMDMIDGDYDNGGVYFGKVKGLDMYVAWRERDHTSPLAIRIYVKTVSREQAKEHVLGILPNARFYR